MNHYYGIECNSTLVETQSIQIKTALYGKPYLSPMKIIQIVPHPPTHFGGISTYSLKLAEELFKMYGIFTDFIIYDPAFQNFPTPIESEINGFPITILPEKTPEAVLYFLAKNNCKAIILHYNQPSSDRFSSLYWLFKALQFTVKENKFKLVVIFHELSYHFSARNIEIFHPLRLFAGRGIARNADSIITASAGFQAMLSKWVKHPVKCMPVISNIGEPEHALPLKERKRRMIIFGREYSRDRVYKKYLKEVLLCCKILKIEEIYDVGSPGVKLPKLNEIRIVDIGEQPPEVVSQLMLTSLAGFFDYSHCPGDLGKSGIFAAYCAHGLIPISSAYNPSETTGLEINKHYVIAHEQLKNLNLMQLQSIVDNARKWYGNHSLIEHTKLIASSLNL